MKKNLFHIVLAFLLTFAVTDYIWLELLGNQKVLVELETEKEKESEEEIRDDRPSENKHEHLDLYYAFGSQFSSQRSQVDLNAIDKSLNDFIDLSGPKLFILHKQLRIHC